MAAPFRVMASDDQGKMWDLRGWTPAVRTGVEHRPAQERDWIPAPEGTRLQYLQGRNPLGWPKGSVFPEAATALDGALAVAAQLPSGYTRTLLPSYVRSDGMPYLPFFGYTAVAFREGKPWVAA